MHQLLRLLIVLVVIGLLLGGCYFQQGGWMMMNPKYDESRLLGLTSADVIKRLGTPSYDPRTPYRASTKWFNEAEDGPLVIGYYQNWATCRIEFKDDRVVSVRRYWK